MGNSKVTAIVYGVGEIRRKIRNYFKVAKSNTIHSQTGCPRSKINK